MDAELLWKLIPIGTGIVGYIGGIFSEPIKAALKRKQEAKHLKVALYAELFRNLDIVEQAVTRLKKDRDYLSRYNPLPEHLSFECYEHCKKEQSLVFSLLPGAAILSNIYSLLNSLVKQPRGAQHLSAVLEESHEIIINLILSRSLDPFLLHAVDARRMNVLPVRRRLRLQLWQLLRSPFKRPDLLRLGNLSPVPAKVRPLDALIDAKTKELEESKRAMSDVLTAFGIGTKLAPPPVRPKS